MTSTPIVEWAYQQSSSLLAPLGDRWLHIQGVAQQAKRVGTMFEEQERTILVAAAWLHDIGYASSLATTGFHPLDGAAYLKAQGKKRLASLVAYHSEAQFEAQLRGLGAQLAHYSREHSALADALTYCDLTTSSTGQQVTFQERLHDIFARYDEAHLVHKAIERAIPSLSQAIERTEQRLQSACLHKDV